MNLRLALVALVLAVALPVLLAQRAGGSQQAGPALGEPPGTTTPGLASVGPHPTSRGAVPLTGGQRSAAVPTAAGPAPLRIREAAPPAISALEAVIVDEASGAILWARAPHRRVAVASLTKIVTALVALERGRLDARVPIDVDYRTLDDSTVMGLLPGEEITLEDLLFGLMLPSGNDAALAIARYVAGSEEAFVSLMNEKAADLGLSDSRFANPHGLDALGHYSSAYDMAMAARYGMLVDSTFRRLAGTKQWTAQGRREVYELWNLNRLLYGQYAGADGVKIGYTDEAGRAMVASATRQGRRVYASFVHSENLVADAAALLDYAFTNFAWMP